MKYECTYPEPKGAKCGENCCISCTHSHVCQSRCSFIDVKKFGRPKCVYVLAISELKNKYVSKFEEVVMLNEAIKKIQDEIEAEKSNSYVLYVGKQMIEHINKNPGYAQNILEEGKTIKGSLEEMRKEAAKVKQGNMAVIPPDQGMRIVFDYFGIKEVVEEEIEDVRPKRNVNISLDDLF
jgi:hypothetical protein